MDSLTACGIALWLGFLTSISPCPLTMNVAAVSFIARKLSGAGKVVFAGILYTLGRVAAYISLGFVTLAGLLSTPGLSNFLQTYLNKFVGPILIVAGMFLCRLLESTMSFSFSTPGLEERAGRGGSPWTFVLGFVFALSFCPPSAALFFGSLIPLSMRESSNLLIPAMYGIGTGIPVVFFSFVIAGGARRLGTAFNKMKQFEWWARHITGTVFIGAGIYYSFIYIYGV